MLDRGFDVILNQKVKGKVEMGNQVPRDNAMYTKMQKDDVLAMQKRLGKKELKFSDYIPNSMKLKRRGSKVSLASTMVGTTPGLSRAMSGLPGGSMMGPNGVIHNYNQNSDFSMLNDVSSILNMSSSMDHKRTRNDNVTGHDRFLPLKTMPSVQTHLTLDEATTLYGTPSRVNTVASHKMNDYQ